MSIPGVQQSLMGTGMAKGMQFGAGGLTSQLPERAFRRQEAYGYINPGYGMQGKQVFKYGAMYGPTGLVTLESSDLKSRVERSKARSRQAVTQRRVGGKFAKNYTDVSYSPFDSGSGEVVSARPSPLKHELPDKPRRRVYTEGDSSPYSVPEWKKKVLNDPKAKAFRQALRNNKSQSSKPIITAGSTSAGVQSSKMGMSGVGRNISKQFSALSTRSKIGFGVVGGVAAAVGAGVTLNSIRGSKDHPISSGIGMGVGAAGLAAGLKGAGMIGQRHWASASKAARNPARDAAFAFSRSAAKMSWGKVGGIGLLAGGAVAGLGMARRTGNR